MNYSELVQVSFDDMPMAKATDPLKVDLGLPKGRYQFGSCGVTVPKTDRLASYTGFPLFRDGDRKRTSVIGTGKFTGIFYLDGKRHRIENHWLGNVAPQELANKWLELVGYTDEITVDKFGSEGETVKTRFPIFKIEPISELEKLQAELAAATTSAKKKSIQEKIDLLMAEK